MLISYVVGAVALCLGILSQFEAEDEVLIATKGVALVNSRAKVFQFLSDMRNYKKWYPRVAEFEPTDMAPMSTGKHFMVTYSYTFFGEVQYSVMISGYESPKYMAFFIDDWLRTRIELTVERKQDGHYPTFCTWSMYSRNKSYFMKYVVAPVLGFSYTGEARSALLNLRYHLLP